ncbi:transcriptional regulator ExuR [Gilliamella sp. Pas-s25]|uniref:transcriptional regulator ExuR n=1 Tax=Gilliamella sp. Pas-s25 TaxID=2687310 RepID=UPI00135E3EFB|nr:transcriptional regulator ExuR [Gilliamella sp. Pas-s25]MWP60972.1 transcriptional regulator ExuR [Gilliamella sp. Pas-s25]
MTQEQNEYQRLYQIIATELKKRIINGIYPVGSKLPSERLICEELEVSRSVVREAIIMLEVEGFVDARKGSGIHVIANSLQSNILTSSPGLNFSTTGPFELLQARQLIESNIAEFAATQITKDDIVKLLEIQHNAKQEDHYRDSNWDLKFHTQIAMITRNTALITIVQETWRQRTLNPLWKKLHEHVQQQDIESWWEEHDKILEALINRDPKAAKLAMWQHLENTKKMLFDATSEDFETKRDHYLFSDNPVVSINEDNYE